MARELERLRSLLEAPSPAVLTTYRKDGSAFVSPVWFRWSNDALELVIAEAISSSAISLATAAAS
jgi:Pyridoxamine 5'-phosphate oxidase